MKKEIHKLRINNLFGTLNIYENMNIKFVIKNTINLFCPISDKLKNIIEISLVKKNMKRVDNPIEDEFFMNILFT